MIAGTNDSKRLAKHIGYALEYGRTALCAELVRICSSPEDANWLADQIALGTAQPAYWRHETYSNTGMIRGKGDGFARWARRLWLPK